MSPAPPVCCVAFDFDGTLVDSNPIKRGAYFEILEHVPGSAAVIEDVLARDPGADRHGVLSAVHAALAAREVSGLAGPDALVGAYSQVCEERVAACAEIPGALDALDALATGHALYLASATPEDALVRVIEARRWASRFDGAYGGPRSKVENLERIADREDIDRGQIVYVGDGEVDRRAAEDFGCAFYGIGTTPDSLPAGNLAPLAPLVREIAARTSAR